MTCIVGIAHNGTVTIGGDSAGVAGNHRTIRSDTKVFANGPMIFGFTSSYRMGQLLRYQLAVPKQHDDEPMTYMCGRFIDAVRDTLRMGGYMRTDNGAEQGGCFLVGYAGTIYQIDSDFQVGIPADGYAAIGCGDEFAIGALAATPHLPPADRIQTALRVAARYSTGVAEPFTIINN